MEQMTAQTQALLQALADGSMNTSQFPIFQNFDKVVKNFLTFNSPIFDMLPRIGVSDMTTHWQVLDTIECDTDGTFEEGGTTEAVNYSYSSDSSSLKHQGVKGVYTDTMRDLDAKNGGRNLADLFRNNLAVLKELTEIQILGGAASDLPNPANANVKLTAIAHEDGLLGADTYYVYVCALTLSGMYKKTVDVQMPNLKLKANGHTTTAMGTITTDIASDIKIEIPMIENAFGYAIFAGTSQSNASLQVISSRNKFILSKLVSGGQLANTITTNTTCPLTSKNESRQFMGLAQFAADKGDIYMSLDGDSFTSNGKEGVQEIDDMLDELYNKYTLSPSVFYVGSDVQQAFTDAYTKNGGHLVSVPVDGRITANQQVEVYRNQRANLAPIRIVVHPLLPASAFIAVTEQLPYEQNRVPNVMDFAVLTEYHAEQFARVSHETTYDVSGITTLRHYMPKSIAVIMNIGKGIK